MMTDHEEKSDGMAMVPGGRSKETETKGEATRGLSPEEKAELIEAAKKELSGIFVEEGPPLAFEFDPVLPDMQTFAESVGRSKKMVLGDYDAEAAEDGSIQRIHPRQTWTSGQKRKMFGGKPSESTALMENQRLAASVDGHLSMEKEAERDLKRKERKMHKEQERIYREQQKELDRQQREQEKKLKAQQKEEEKQKLQLERDMKKLERDMERERKAEERKKQQEDRKREKDLQKALAAQVKVAQRELQKELAAGPPDDLDLEMDNLLKQAPLDEPLPDRPAFPLNEIELESAFPELGNKIGGDVLMIWGFVQSFSDIVALPPFSINNFVKALHIGQKSVLLSNIHIVLIRLVQADMEESHHVVLTQGSGGTSNFMDRAVVGIAGSLDEAVSWGFDVDAWRAHLNQFTWPEILRQIAVAAGYGAKRSRGLRDKNQSSPGIGEESAMDESRVGYGLKMPSRLTQGTVKAAAWQVLSEVGPKGLTISEIASRIQKHGLRDLRTSKTPEATVAGALSRDAVFCRVAPATYALHAVLPSAENQSHHSSVLDGGDSVRDEPPEDEPVDEMDVDKFVHGETWIPLLSNGDYTMLSLEQRLDVLKTLCSMALECPTIRACLDSRLDREVAAQKRLDVEAKAEKRARREQAAEETQRRLMELESSGNVESHENFDAKVKDIMTESLQSAIPGPITSRNEAASAQDQIRLEPIGRDRRYNRYWTFACKDSTEQEAGVPGPLFAELNGQFKIIRSNEQLDALIKSLEIRGAREGPLYFALTSYRRGLKDELPLWKEASISFPEEEATDDVQSLDPVHVLARKWVRPTSLERQLRMQSDWLLQLKTRLANMEAALPPETKQEFDSVTWSADLEKATSLDQLIGLIGRFEFALSAHVLHSNYNRSPQILFGAWSDSYDPETAIFLHLLTLDSSLCYHAGSPSGRESLLSYKYVQKPFVQELNAHIDVASVARSSENTSQVVSVEPVRVGGKLASSSFPVLQKGTPVQKRPLPFSFQVEKVREAVQAAERSGTLYANIQLTKKRGRPSGKQNGSKGMLSGPTSKHTSSELGDEVSTSAVVSSDDDAEAHDDYLDDESIERSDMSRDEPPDDDDYHL